MAKLEGQIAFVVGAGRGIGRAIAEGLSRDGAQLMLCARTEAELHPLAESLSARGPRALAFPLDARHGDDVRRAINDCEAALGPISLLVSSVGVAGPFGPLGRVDEQAWWAAARTHVQAPLHLLGAILPRMKARGAGRIINVGSLAASRVSANLSAYEVGKAAQRALFLHAAVEATASGVSVFNLEPGAVFTQLSENVLQSADARVWTPALVEFVSLLRDRSHPTFALDLCVRQSLALAAGGYDALSGVDIAATDDLDDLLARRVRTSAPAAPIPCI